MGGIAWGASIARLSAVFAPVGRIETYTRTEGSPAACLECDGRSLLRVDHPALFAKIGTAWGVGDDAEGGTTFSLPKIPRRTLCPPGGTDRIDVTIPITTTAEDGTTTETETTVSLPVAIVITTIRAR